MRPPRASQFQEVVEAEACRQGREEIPEPRRSWNEEFLQLAGSALDFAEPEEPCNADLAPDLE